MLIGSNLNPYKKLLENDSDNKKQEEYLVTLLKGLINEYDREFDYIISDDYQSDMNNPIKDYTNFFEIEEGNTFEVDYSYAIKKILDEFPELEIKQKDNPSFLLELLIDFKKDGGFDDIDEDSFSLDGDIKIGYLQCYIHASIYLSPDRDVFKYTFDKYTNDYHSSYRDYVSVENLLKKLDVEYVENNYENLIDSDYFSSQDIKILNELDCKYDIIDAIDNDRYIEYNYIDFSAYEDRAKKARFDFHVYVESEDFFPKFREYLLSSTSLLGIKSDDNSVWEEEEEE